MKFLNTFIIFFLILFSVKSYSDVIKDVEIKNNVRISKNTILTYGEIELNKDYSPNEINDIIKNLYNTNFFENIEVSISNNILLIDVKENNIIQTVIVEGIKSKTIQNATVKDNICRGPRSIVGLCPSRIDVIVPAINFSVVALAKFVGAFLGFSSSMATLNL